jgi:hypothetical protein
MALWPEFSRSNQNNKPRRTGGVFHFQLSLYEQLMLLRPIRSLMLIGICFLIGYFYARNQASDNCGKDGGEMKNGYCLGVNR